MIGDEGAVFLSYALSHLKNIYFIDLNLSYNSISAEGAA